MAEVPEGACAGMAVCGQTEDLPNLGVALIGYLGEVFSDPLDCECGEIATSCRVRSFAIPLGVIHQHLQGAAGGFGLIKGELTNPLYCDRASQRAPAGLGSRPAQ